MRSFTVSSKGKYHIMQAFLLRIAPLQIDRVDEALASDTIIVGWPEFPQFLDETVTREQMTRLIRDGRYPDDKNNKRAGRKAASVWRFLRVMQVGDLVVVPHDDHIYFGRVQSPPYYLHECADDHTAFRRRVNWLNKDQPVLRHSLPQFLQVAAARRQTCADITESLDEIRTFLAGIGLSLEDAGYIAEEVIDPARYLEGATRQISVNSFERNPAARTACIDHHGLNCAVCGFNFAESYGEIGDGYIHVHHLRDLATIGEEYEVDPVEDLRPVCPNCHAMLHRTVPAMSIADLRAKLQDRAKA